jgi:hypothetical protein
METKVDERISLGIFGGSAAGCDFFKKFMHL